MYSTPIRIFRRRVTEATVWAIRLQTFKVIISAKNVPSLMGVNRVDIAANQFLSCVRSG